MPDLSNKLSQIKELGYKVKLDTNGTNPTLLKRLCGQGLVDHFAMDIKNSPRKYAETCGLKRFSLENVSESISFLMSCGVSYEFRTTLIQEFHSEEDILEIGKWISGAERYYLQRYIDSDNCISHGLHMVPKSVANQYKENLAKTIKIVDLRGYD